MTAETIMQILQWLIPMGSIGSVAAWLVHRDTRKDRANKEKNDIYKSMYDNISGTLIELQNENKRLYKAIRRLNQTIDKAVSCPHYGNCPVRDELQKSERIDPDPPQRQPGGRKKIRDEPRTRAHERGEAKNPDELPYTVADRDGV